MTLMQRRRALMALIEGGADMIPGKRITVQTEITNGEQAKTVFDSLADRPSAGGVYVTTIPESEWVDGQLVFVVMNSAGTISGFCYRNGDIQSVPFESRYDAKSAANTDYYLVEVEVALYPPNYIMAVYTQSGTVYDTDSLDNLKTDLVVTAFYQGGGSKTVTGYTLSGTLTEGTSTITVSYGGKTTTFDVAVTESPLLPTEYQQVEYIANPSDAYFVSNINVPIGYSVHGKAYLSAQPSSPVNVCGAPSSDYSRSFACFSSQNKGHIGAWYGNTNAFTSLDNLYASPTEFTTTFTNNSVSISAKNENGEGTKSANITTTSTTNMQVFRAVPNRGNFVGRLYFLEVLNSQNEATAKLIPCYRKVDNVVGMYDVVNNAFYSSANSTAFTKGGNV